MPADRHATASQVSAPSCRQSRHRRAPCRRVHTCRSPDRSCRPCSTFPSSEVRPALCRPSAVEVVQRVAGLGRRCTRPRVVAAVPYTHCTFAFGGCHRRQTGSSQLSSVQAFAVVAARPAPCRPRSCRSPHRRSPHRCRHPPSSQTASSARRSRVPLMGSQLSSVQTFPSSQRSAAAVHPFACTIADRRCRCRRAGHPVIAPGRGHRPRSRSPNAASQLSSVQTFAVVAPLGACPCLAVVHRSAGLGARRAGIAVVAEACRSARSRQPQSPDRSCRPCSSPVVDDLAAVPAYAVVQRIAGLGPPVQASVVIAVAVLSGSHQSQPLSQLSSVQTSAVVAVRRSCRPTHRSPHRRCRHRRAGIAVIAERRVGAFTQPRPDRSCRPCSTFPSSQFGGVPGRSRAARRRSRTARAGIRVVAVAVGCPRSQMSPAADRSCRPCRRSRRRSSAVPADAVVHRIAGLGTPSCRHRRRRSPAVLSCRHTAITVAWVAAVVRAAHVPVDRSSAVPAGTQTPARRRSVDRVQASSSSASTALFRVHNSPPHRSCRPCRRSAVVAVRAVVPRLRSRTASQVSAVVQASPSSQLRRVGRHVHAARPGSQLSSVQRSRHRIRRCAETQPATASQVSAWCRHPPSSQLAVVVHTPCSCTVELTPSQLSSVQTFRRRRSSAGCTRRRTLADIATGSQVIGPWCRPSPSSQERRVVRVRSRRRGSQLSSVQTFPSSQFGGAPPDASQPARAGVAVVQASPSSQAVGGVVRSSGSHCLVAAVVRADVRRRRSSGAVPATAARSPAIAGVQRRGAGIAVVACRAGCRFGTLSDALMGRSCRPCSSRFRRRRSGAAHLRTPRPSRSSDRWCRHPSLPSWPRRCAVFASRTDRSQLSSVQTFPSSQFGASAAHWQSPPLAGVGARGAGIAVVAQAVGRHVRDAADRIAAVVRADVPVIAGSADRAGLRSRQPSQVSAAGAGIAVVARHASLFVLTQPPAPNRSCRPCRRSRRRSSGVVSAPHTPPVAGVDRGAGITVVAEAVGRHSCWQPLTESQLSSRADIRVVAARRYPA